MRQAAAPQGDDARPEHYPTSGVRHRVPSPLTALLKRLPRPGKKRLRKPQPHHWMELAARAGYGARGLVYLSVGVLTLAAAINLGGDPVSVAGALAWLSRQPTGRFWLIVLGLGLLAFVQWRVLQAVFDADHEGTSREGLQTRFSQGVSGAAYGLVALNAFRLAAWTPSDPDGEAMVRARDTARELIGLPYGHWLLVAGGLTLAGIGVANIVRAWREDFAEHLACSEQTCRRVTPLARAGYIARGAAYLPLAGLIVLAGLRSEPGDAATFESALDAVGRQPGGGWVLALTAIGFIAFGAFSLIEGRFRRIRPPKDLV